MMVPKLPGGRGLPWTASLVSSYRSCVAPLQRADVKVFLGILRVCWDGVETDSHTRQERRDV